MAQMRCNCGSSIQVPDLLARQPVVCPSCRNILNAKPRVPYGYAPFQVWHATPAPTLAPLRATQAAAPASNVPAMISFFSGGLALFASLFLVYDKGDKGVVCLALVGMACATIGLHKSGMVSLRGKGRFLAVHGLLFSVLALMASPLPAGPSCGKLKRRDVPSTPVERRYEVPAAPKPKSERPAIAPVAPKPADNSDEQEEGF